MEKISFLDIFMTSWRLSISRRTFLVFGFFIALPLAAQIFLLPPVDTSPTDQWLTEITLHPTRTIFFLLGYFLFTLFGKGNLIVSLGQTRRDKKESLFSFPSLSRTFSRALILDASIGAFLIVLLILLALPTLIASRTIGSVPETLSLLTLLTFAPIAIVVFFVREFSYFYFLLSPLRLKTALEVSTNYFLHHRTIALWFGLFSLLLSLLFTFFLNLAMLAIVALFQRFTPALPEAIVVFVGSLICFTWYTTFRQTLWFTFFQYLATPKDKTKVVETKTILEEKISESPSV